MSVHHGSGRRRGRQEANWKGIRSEVEAIVAARLRRAPREEIEDATQEAMLQLLQHREREPVVDLERLAARIASCRGVDGVRARSRHRARHAEPREGMTVEDLTAPKTAMGRSREASLDVSWILLVDLLVCEFPRGVAHLVGRLEGLAPRDIAERLHLSPEAERQTWSRCMRKARELVARPDSRYARMREVVAEAIY